MAWEECGDKGQEGIRGRKKNEGDGRSSKMNRECGEKGRSLGDMEIFNFLI